MPRLIDTPSQGKSEVLDTLHYLGAIGSGIELFRIGSIVSHRWMSDENREGSDSTLEADVLTVLGQLQGAGYVVGHNTSGNVVDLTSGTPAGTTRVVLTGTGRVQGRHPRPRPRRIIG